MWMFLVKSNLFWLWWVAAGLILVTGISFYWWRNLRVDCDEEQILGGVLWLVVIFIASLFSIGRIPGIGAIGTGWVVGIGFWAVWSRKNRWNFWEWLDVLIPSGLVITVFTSAAYGPDRLPYAVGYFGAWLACAWAGRNYRNFEWYLSGKPGFGGLAGLMFWAVVEIAVEIWKGGGIYLFGLTMEQWFSTWILVAAGVTLYLRSGRRITRDLKFSKHR